MSGLIRSARAFFKVIFRNRQATIGFFILLFFVLLATVGAELIPLNQQPDYANRFLPLSFRHLLGTDFLGRDTFAQVVHGSRDVISIGIVGASLSLLLGIVMGAIAGFFGKAVDTVFNFIITIFLSIPAFPLMLILAVMLNAQSVWAAGIILAVVSWGGVARIVRGQILSLKHSEFVIAGRIMGLSGRYIVVKEVLPNMVSMLATNFIGLFQGAVASSMALMLLGAMAYNTSNWGVMLSMAKEQTGVIYNLNGLPYLLTPIICLAVLQLGCIFFTSGIDQALNPKLRTE